MMAASYAFDEGLAMSQSKEDGLEAEMMVFRYYDLYSRSVYRSRET